MLAIFLTILALILGWLMLLTQAPKPSNCGTCNKDHNRMFNERRECSHVDCPYRPKAWGPSLNPFPKEEQDKD